MDAKFLNQSVKPEEIQKAIIASKFSNKDEVLKSDEQVEFEDKVRKGEVDVITNDDIKETYGDNAWLRADIDKLNKAIDDTIQKGEDEYITEKEWNEINTAKSELDTLVSKAIAIEKGGSTHYMEVFVKPADENSENETEDDGEGSKEV